MRRQPEHDGGCVALRRGLERLRADQHANVEQDGEIRDHRYDGQHQGNDAEPGQDNHHDTDRGRIADPAAHAFPAGWPI